MTRTPKYDPVTSEVFAADCGQIPRFQGKSCCSVNYETFHTTDCGLFVSVMMLWFTNMVFGFAIKIENVFSEFPLKVVP